MAARKARNGVRSAERNRARSGVCSPAPPRRRAERPTHRPAGPGAPGHPEPPEPPVLRPARSGIGHPGLGRAVGARCHPAPPLPRIRAGLFRRSGAGVRLAGGEEGPAWIPRTEGNRRCEAGAGAELRPPARPGCAAAPSPAPGQPRPRGSVPVWALLRPCSVWGPHAAPAGHRSGPVTPPPGHGPAGSPPMPRPRRPWTASRDPFTPEPGTHKGARAARPGPESHPVLPAVQQPQCWLPGGLQSWSSPSRTPGLGTPRADPLHG